MNLRDHFSEFEIKIILEALDLYEIRCNNFVRRLRTINKDMNMRALNVKGSRARQIKQKIINNLLDI